MAVDRWDLLEWMVDREDRESGTPTIYGAEFLNRAAHDLAPGEPGSADAVARSAAHLKRVNHIDWTYIPVPNVDSPEPRPEFINNSFIQRVHGIHVTGPGLFAVELRRTQRSPTQINITNSSIGQLALRDISNLNIFVILEEMGRALDSVEAAPAEKEAARSALARMREAGATVATSAAGSVLSAALRHALGLP
jgi:hypothetical protein